MMNPLVNAYNRTSTQNGWNWTGSLPSGTPTADTHGDDATAAPADQPTLTKIEAGHYRHNPSGAFIIRRPKSRLGRTGFVNAGWAIVVGLREVSRWSTLAVASAHADEL